MQKVLRWIGAVFAFLFELNERVTDFLAGVLSRFARRVSLIVILLFGGGVTYKLATATRNASGTYSLPSGNPVVSGTSISTTWANNTLSDLSSEMSDSLSRSGKGGMTAALKGTDGTVAAPAYSFTSEPGTGLYRIGTSNIALSLNGSKAVDYTTNGIRVLNGAVATPSLSFLNDTGSGLYRIGSNNIGFAINGVGVTEWNASTFSVAGAAPSIGSTPSLSVRSASGQSNFYMEDGRGAAGNRVGRLIYDGGSNGGGTGNLSKPGWQFQVVGDTGGFSSSGITIFRDGGATLGGSGTAIVTVNAGVNANGSGIKHQSHTGCATAAAAGATCTDTLTWTTAFADSAYQAVCTCNATTSGHPTIESYTNSGDGVSITIKTVAITAAAAQCSVIVCTAMHD